MFSAGKPTRCSFLLIAFLAIMTFWRFRILPVIKHPSTELLIDTIKASLDFTAFPSLEVGRNQPLGVVWEVNGLGWRPETVNC